MQRNYRTCGKKKLSLMVGAAKEQENHCLVKVMNGLDSEQGRDSLKNVVD
jgi:hypothetical protein